MKAKRTETDNFLGHLGKMARAAKKGSNTIVCFRCGKSAEIGPKGVRCPRCSDPTRIDKPKKRIYRTIEPEEHPDTGEVFGEARCLYVQPGKGRAEDTYHLQCACGKQFSLGASRFHRIKHRLECNHL